MDLDAVTEELYAASPDSFVARRTELAAEAKASGDRELAAAVRALRRPTVAAWVTNLLVRHDRSALDDLLALGASLRQAQDSLAADALRSLSRERHRVVAALAERGAALAREEGGRVTTEVVREVEQTLEAALADDRLAGQLMRGALVTPLVYAGFGERAATADSPTVPEVRAAAPGARARIKKADAGKAEAERAESERRERDRLEAERRAAERARAQQVLDEARRQEQEQADALEGVGAQVEELRARLASLEQERDEAEQRLESARQARTEAESNLRELGD